MPIGVAYTPPESQPSASVPPGHRTKCRKCGAVDSIKLAGLNRVKRCGICGATIAQRRAPRKPNIISFEVIYSLNGESFGRSSHVTVFSAEIACRNFVERGPVARVRIAQLVELLDGMRTGNVRQLRYDNYRGRRQSIVWQGGCETCKGRGLIAVKVPAKPRDPLGRGDKVLDKPTIKYISCESCSGLGGELTREVNYRRLVI